MSASPDLLRTLLTTFLDTLMSGEADSMCGADYGTSSPDRVDRDGYRHREPGTSPSRNCGKGFCFPGWFLERRKRAEAAPTSVVAACYLLGVSTRRMEEPGRNARPPCAARLVLGCDHPFGQPRAANGPTVGDSFSPQAGTPNVPSARLRATAVSGGPRTMAEGGP
jgi:hypothetical protein